jgi:hypothetical protein
MSLFADLHYGIYIIGAALLLFYLRMAQIRGRKRRLIKKELIQRKEMGPGKARKVLGEIQADPNKPAYDVRSWWLVGASIVLMLFGMAVYNGTWMPQPFDDFWWTPVVVGVLLLTYAIV